jgi:hypothetical protein
MRVKPRKLRRVRQNFEWWPQRDTIELAEFKYAISLHADRLTRVRCRPAGPAPVLGLDVVARAGFEPATFGL